VRLVVFAGMVASTPQIAPLVHDRRDRIPALDGVRGVAMLAVVCCHLIFPGLVANLDVLDRIMIHGWLGVDLFFVLSGFLITGILIDTRDDAGFFRSFYARRALRIFPIYYLLLVVLFVWIPFGSWFYAHGMGWQYSQLRAHQAWYWTYLVNVLQVRSSVTEWFWSGHLWSLSVEEQFYLVWPAVVLVTARKHLAKVCVLAFITAIALRVGWAFTHKVLLGAYVLTPMRMDSLAAGALVAVLARSSDGSAMLLRWYKRVGIGALIVGVPLFAAVGDDVQNLNITLIGYSLSAAVFASAIVWVIVDRRPRRLMEWRPLRAVGRISYGGYLYHLPIIGLCEGLRARLVLFGATGAWQLWAAHAAWIVLIVSLTLLVSVLSYRLIEQPFLALKDRMGTRSGALVPHVAVTGGIE
jgi:peptidoglycan/LPS O-acetylase OafA/YrhL